MNNPRSMKDVSDLYNKGVNIMKLFRDLESSSSNSLQAILISYDMQAGSYIELMTDPEHREFINNYTSSIASIFNNMNCHSILEAGVGEATTLANIIAKMKNTPKDIFGFDLSWSRVIYAKKYSKARNISANLFVGNLLEIPILTNSIDVVYTSHSIEPNRGKEKEILSELYRIAKRYLVLLEPSNELGSVQTRQRIEEHKYCKDLYKHAKELGYKVVEYRLFDYCNNPCNQTALMIIEKQMSEQSNHQNYFACPTCKNALIFHRGNYYCNRCFLIFPIIEDTPCLMSSNGILGSKYLQHTEQP